MIDIDNLDETFDFSRAKPVDEIPAFKKLRQAYKSEQSFFDEDVLIWLKEHPNSRQYVNDMLRNVIAMQS